MIPFRCYADLYELMEILKTPNFGDHDVPWVLGYVIQKLEGIIERWEFRDDSELCDMAEEHERSEKDCMWEARE